MKTTWDKQQEERLRRNAQLERQHQELMDLQTKTLVTQSKSILCLCLATALQIAAIAVHLYKIWLAR